LHRVTPPGPPRSGLFRGSSVPRGRPLRDRPYEGEPRFGSTTRGPAHSFTSRITSLTRNRNTRPESLAGGDVPSPSAVVQ
jgi:hypothetical protein